MRCLGHFYEFLYNIWSVEYNIFPFLVITVSFCVYFFYDLKFFLPSENVLKFLIFFVNAIFWKSLFCFNENNISFKEIDRKKFFENSDKKKCEYINSYIWMENRQNINKWIWHFICMNILLLLNQLKCTSMVAVTQNLSLPLKPVFSGEKISTHKHICFHTVLTIVPRIKFLLFKTRNSRHCLSISISCSFISESGLVFKIFIFKFSVKFFENWDPLLNKYNHARTSMKNALPIRILPKNRLFFQNFPDLNTKKSFQNLPNISHHQLFFRIVIIGEKLFFSDLSYKLPSGVSKFSLIYPLTDQTAKCLRISNNFRTDISQPYSDDCC
jgi:hypothetical protein